MKNTQNLKLKISNVRDAPSQPPYPEPVQITNFKYLEDDDDDDDVSENEKFATTKKTQKVPPVAYIKLFKYSTCVDKILILISLVTAVGSGLCTPANILIYGSLIGDMVTSATEAATGTSDIESTAMNILESVETFAILNSLLGIAMFIFTYISIVLLNYTAQKQAYCIRRLYLKSALHQDITWYDSMRSGDVASRLTEDVMKFEEGVGEKLAMFVHSMTAFVACIILAFFKGWKLALVCIISLPVTSLVLTGVSLITSKLTRKETEVYAQAGNIAEEVISSIRTVVAFGGQHLEVERYKSNLQSTFKNNLKKSFCSGCGFGLLWLAIYGNYALSFWYGVTLIIEDMSLPTDERIYTAAVMMTVFLSIMMGTVNIGTIAPFIEAFGIAQGAAAKVFSVIDRQSLIDSQSEEGLKLADIAGSIEFKNVSFEYPTRPDVKVLTKLNLTIKKGQTVALVGSSGCGKSTCIQLIQRFYDPREGQVLLDGHDMRELNIAWFRSCIGVVGQEPVLFDTTIAENIRYGNLDATMEEIEYAAKEANAHDFIMKLPFQYNTQVGEKGAQISGGQKQRIAIARALVRKPNILLLDEATSALDTRSEAKVQEALDKASKGRTTVIVAHRLSTIRAADKIIVLSNGSVVEEGTHGELMMKRSHYYSLVMTQIANLGDDNNTPTPQIDKEKEIDEDEKEVVILSEDEIEIDASKNKTVSLFEIIKLNAPEWPFITVACLTSIIVGASTPVFAILFGEILGVMSETDTSVIRSDTNKYCLYFLLGGIIMGTSTFFQHFFFGTASESLILRLRGSLFEAMMKQDIAWFDHPDNGTGALCSKLSTETTAIKGATGQPIGTLMQSVSTIVIAAGISLFYEWRLGLVGMCIMPFILASTYMQGKVIRKETLNYHTGLERSTKLAVEAVGNIRTVVSLGREDIFHSGYVNAITPAFIEGKRNTHIRGLIYGLARSMPFFAYAIVMYYGGYLIETEGLEFTVVFKVAQSLVSSSAMVASALSHTPNFQKGITTAEKVINLLNRIPKVLDPVDPNDEKWKPDGSVDYEQIKFEYPTRPGINVFNSLNLEITPGQTVALIGPSGCGKSTLIQLLQRFYDPTSGSVQIGKTNIATIKQSTMRMELGLVSQEPSLFARTIAENIAYGDNSREVNMTEIVEAAKKVNIHNFISSLPLGYNTILGDKGTQLSGGQKQRVAIARALIRNPRILLLDEATSALDAESERIVQAAIDEVKEGRTCIMIAHRLSTVQDADKICVIDNGVVAESGTHAELIKDRGLYYKLLKMQH